MVQFPAGKRCVSFRKYPDWFWDTPSFLSMSNGFKQPGHELNSHIHVVLMLRLHGALPSHPHKPSRHVLVYALGQLYLLFYGALVTLDCIVSDSIMICV